MSSARSVARELVRLSGSGALPDPLTHYRLRCLLYYAQGWSLALRDSELFPDDLDALVDGPAVPAVRAVQDEPHTWQVIQPDTFEREPDLDQEDEGQFLRALWDAYGKLSTTGFYTLIHQEPLFLHARLEREAGGACLIDVGELQKSFACRPDLPGPLCSYQHARQQREREAALAIQNSPPLDVDAIWKGCRSVTPTVR